MNYRVRFTAHGWRGRQPNDWVRKYLAYASPRAVIREIKSHYNYSEDTHDFRAVEIDLFEDTSELRLVATKRSGCVNFSWCRH